MASTDLVFEGAPLLTGDLVFGDDGGSVIPDAVISGAITLTRPSLVGQVVLGIQVEGTVSLARPTLTGEVEYHTDTQRPLTATVQARWQDAVPQPTRVEQATQDAQRMPTHVEARWQEALQVFSSSEIAWVDATRVQNRQTVRFQDGEKRRTGSWQRMQDGERQTVRSRQRFQEGDSLRQGAYARFQDATRGLAGQHQVRYQEALPLQRAVESIIKASLPLQRGWWNRYQEAWPPRPGRTQFHPDPPDPGEPCYTPSGDLVFEMPWSADTNLVFVCDAHGPGPDPEPGATIVVPIRKVYVVLNSATLRRVDGDILLPTFSLNMSLDTDSWTWSFSAALPGRAKADLEPASDGTPVIVEATINGVAYRFYAERMTRDRGFAEDGLRITGRGLAAELDAPIAPVLSFGITNPAGRTANQLMEDVLSINGVPLPGWTVDWQMEDWNIPAGAWARQGTYIEALNDIVAAAGGYLQPTPATKSVRALLRYPALPWAWDEVTPDFELPAAAFTREGVEWTEKARYDRVYVSGQGTGGRLVNVKREGTAGEIVAPMVTDPLITDTIAGRQRGASILADTGRIATYSLRGAAGVRDTDNNPVGIIPPGKFVRYVDNGVPRIGITRSVSVDVSMPDIWQTLTVETHETA